MKLNWAERWVVNNPLRVLEQRFEVRWMRKAHPIPEKTKVLEVGCGRGAGADLIRKSFHPSSLYALDLDVNMVVMAKEYLSRRNGSKVSLTAGDVLRLPIKDHILDAVFGFGVLHHVPDWRGALREISRVLKPGGLYFIEELYPTLYQNMITKHILLHPKKDRFFSRDLRDALQSSGMPLHKARDINIAGIIGVAIKI